MKGGLFFGILCSAAIHAAILLFGGLPFARRVDHGSLQQVDLLSPEDAKKEEQKKKEEPPEEKKEEIEAVKDEPPEAAEIVQRTEISAAQSAPELEAASLSAIDAALSGAAGAGGDFGDSVSFASGGRIGGIGKPGANAGGLDREFNLSEIDQKPRAVYQAPPAYPSGMRKVEGVVTVIFIVDAAGRVSKARVEKSSQPEFEAPALEAVRKWKFEPALKGGERVACRMRVPIRFQPR